MPYSQLEMRSTIRCGVCSTCLTLLVSSDSAGGGLGRARVVSLRGVLFSFFGKNIPTSYLYVYSQIHTGTCINLIYFMQENGGWSKFLVACTPGEHEVEGSIPGVLYFFWWVYRLLFHVFLLGIVVCVNRVYLDLIDYNYTLYTAVRRTSIPVCICINLRWILAAAALCCFRLLLLLQLQCCCLPLWPIASDSSFFFLHSNTICFLMFPLAVQLLQPRFTS